MTKTINESDRLLCPELAPVFSSMDFLRELTGKIDSAREKIMIQAMTFEADHVGLLITNHLFAACQRGIPVYLNVDNWVNMMTLRRRNSWLPISDRHNGWRQHLKNCSQANLKELEDHGARVVITNRIFMPADVFPYAFRNHKKTTVVDQTAYLGGINISHEIFERHDFMVKITQPAIVEALATEFYRNNSKRPTRNEIINCDPDNSLLVDCGSGRSLILDTACDLICQSHQSIDVATPRQPRGKLKDALLRAAAKGIPINYFGNRPFTDQSHQPKTIRTFLSTDRPSHVRLLRVDDTVLFGSSTFNDLLVIGRHEDLNLLSQSKSFVDPLTEYFSGLVAKQRMV